jgi:hypothetical protein
MGRTSRALGILSPGAPEDKRFRGFFGVSAEVAVKAWGMMEEHDLLPPTPQFCHYLWALAFMRTYPPNDMTLSRSLGGSDPKTIYKYIWPFIESLSELDYFVVSWLLHCCCISRINQLKLNIFSPIQIEFENRKRGDIGNDCLLSVDGTDFRIAMGYSKPFWSYKFKKSGVRYEVGLCILTGDICWWNGPYEPGIWNDGMIFEDALKLNLEFGERCETDAGYRGSAPEFVKCPGGVWGESAKREMQQKVRSRQETVNERLKNWGILTTPYRHDLRKHQTVFAAVITLLQLSLEHNPLFSVEYND